jgi:hypothetical protein
VQVHVHARARACTHACVHARIRACTCERARAGAHARVHACACACTRTRTCACASERASAHAHAVASARVHSHALVSSHENSVNVHICVRMRVRVRVHVRVHQAALCLQRIRIGARQMLTVFTFGLAGSRFNRKATALSCCWPEICTASTDTDTCLTCTFRWVYTYRPVTHVRNGSRKLIIKKSGVRAQNSIFESTLRTRDPHLFS